MIATKTVPPKGKRRLVGNMDKEIDKIGVVPKRESFNERQLARMYAMVIEEGCSKTRITVLGPDTSQGRKKIRSQLASNAEAPRVARQLCNSFKILRSNVEIRDETKED